jgi:hypothetical protein
MLDKSKNLKTYGDLVNIFEKSYKDPSFVDISKDLRILKYTEDMKNKKWTEPIILLYNSHEKIAVDGIHRGIAYLRCIADGVREELLPEVYIVNL